MNKLVEKFGAYADACLAEHPERTAGLLRLAYRGVGLQASRFPSKKRASSREYLQGYTAGLMARMLDDPSDSAIVNIFMPSEIFHALGIPVLAPEGLAAYIACTGADRAFVDAAEEKGASGTLCSYHKVLLGAAETRLLKPPLLVANTTLACDANQLTFRRLAQHWHVPHIVIDVPFDIEENDTDAVDYVAAQLRQMGREAEEAVHRKLDPAKLSACVAKSREALALYGQYLKIRSEAHFPESFTPELLTAINYKLYLGTDEAVEYSRRLRKDAETMPRHTTEKRVLWIHTLPNWQSEIMDIFQGADNHRVEVVGCDFAASTIFTDLDPEKPYESMAKRLLTDSFNGPGSRRIDRALALARELGADGIVIFCQWGCKQTQGLALHAKEVFTANGFPTLIFDGDGADRANGGSQQAVTRCSAFVEQLEAGGKEG